jgi:hypothetical protein
MLFRKSTDPILKVPRYVKCITTSCIPYHVSPIICDPTIERTGINSEGIMSLI